MPDIPHRTDIQIRFNDSDALGHINNASYVTYAELARLDFVARLGYAVTSLILASLHVEYRRQVSLHDRVHVESWVTRLGNTSFGLDQTIFANGEVAADITSVIVMFDYDANKPMPLTAAMRADLRAGMRAPAETRSGSASGT
jgi:acyl-CoA thioester hydrolase